MAKKEVSNYPYPSRFGSSSSMLTGEKDERGFVQCKDEFGLYFTDPKNINSNECDPYRTSQRRLTKLFQGKKGE